MSSLKVSICVPAYNMARYLPRTLESVLSQEYGDFELVICDDGSTDRTPEICHSYDDPRIRYIRLPGKSGQAGNFNRCLREARGEYFTILHADDYFLPGFIADRVARLDADREAGFVFGAVRVVDAEDGVVNASSGRWAEDRRFARGELLESLLFGCIVCPPSMMVRRACAEIVGEFRTDYTWGHDWEWALRLAEHCGAIYASQPLAAYRVHDGSGTAEILSASKNGPQERRILGDTLDRVTKAYPHLARLRRPVFEALSRRHMYFAEQSLIGGRREAARHNLKYAALADRWMTVRPTFWALLAGSYAPLGFYSFYRRLRHGAPVETAPAG